MAYNPGLEKMQASAPPQAQGETQEEPAGKQAGRIGTKLLLGSKIREGNTDTFLPLHHWPSLVKNKVAS